MINQPIMISLELFKKRISSINSLDFLSSSSSSLMLMHMISSLCLIFLLSLMLKKLRLNKRLPPGPWSIPFIGYRFGPYAWREMEEISRIYGPVSSIRIGTNLLVIIGSVKPALTLLESRSSIYCDRPELEMAGNVMSGGLRTLCLGYNERWKRFRKVLHSQLDNRSASMYESVQEKASRQMILDIYHQPDKFTDALTRYSASVIMKMTYGKRSQTSSEDEEVRLVSKTLKRFSHAARIGAYSIDRFKWLRYIPGWLDEPKRWHEEELGLFKSQIDKVKKDLKERPGLREKCFVSYILERQKEFGLSDQESAYLAGSLFGAGSDTTSAALSVIIFAAVCHPEEVLKVQEELDRVVGPNRMPTFSDCSELPMVTAFFSETFRWRPVSAGGFMHATVKDDVYEGLLIPKGSWVVGNHWSIHRDESVFPKPDRFDLSRWLKIDEVTGMTVLRKEMRHFAYGFGRRKCAGSNVADRSLFINTANLLWAFDLKPRRDREGSLMKIDTMAFEDSANSRPKNFQVDFSVRKPNLLKIIEVEMT